MPEMNGQRCCCHQWIPYCYWWSLEIQTCHCSICGSSLKVRLDTNRWIIDYKPNHLDLTKMAVDDDEVPFEWSVSTLDHHLAIKVFHCHCLIPLNMSPCWLLWLVLALSSVVQWYFNLQHWLWFVLYILYGMCSCVCVDNSVQTSHSILNLNQMMDGGEWKGEAKEAKILIKSPVNCFMSDSSLSSTSSVILTSTQPQNFAFCQLPTEDHSSCDIHEDRLINSQEEKKEKRKRYRDGFCAKTESFQRWMKSCSDIFHIHS